MEHVGSEGKVGVIREGLLEEVTSGTWRDKNGQVGFRYGGQGISDKRNSLCKGPEVEQS